MKNLTTLVISSVFLTVFLTRVHSGGEQRFGHPLTDYTHEPMDTSEDSGLSEELKHNFTNMRNILSNLRMKVSTNVEEDSGLSEELKHNFTEELKHKFTNMHKILNELCKRLDQVSKTRINSQEKVEKALQENDWPIGLAEYYCNSDFEQIANRFQRCRHYFYKDPKLRYIWMKHLINKNLGSSKYMMIGDKNVYILKEIIQEISQEAMDKEIDKETDIEKLRAIIKQLHNPQNKREIDFEMTIPLIGTAILNKTDPQIRKPLFNLLCRAVLFKYKMAYGLSSKGEGDFHLYEMVQLIKGKRDTVFWSSPDLRKFREKFREKLLCNVNYINARKEAEWILNTCESQRDVMYFPQGCKLYYTIKQSRRTIKNFLEWMDYDVGEHGPTQYSVSFKKQKSMEEFKRDLNVLIQILHGDLDPVLKALEKIFYEYFEEPGTDLPTFFRELQNNEIINRSSPQMPQLPDELPMATVIDWVDDITVFKDIVKNAYKTIPSINFSSPMSGSPLHDQIQTLCYSKIYSNLLGILIKHCEKHFGFDSHGKCVKIPQYVMEYVEGTSLQDSGASTSPSERANYCIDLVTKLKIAIQAHAENLHKIISKWENKPDDETEQCYQSFACTFSVGCTELEIFYKSVGDENCEGYNEVLASMFKNHFERFHQTSEEDKESYRENMESLLRIGNKVQLLDNFQKETIRIIYKLIFTFTHIEDERFKHMAWMRYWGKSGIERKRIDDESILGIPMNDFNMEFPEGTYEAVYSR